MYIFLIISKKTKKNKEHELNFPRKSNDPPYMCASVHRSAVCVCTQVIIIIIYRASSSYLQGFPLTVEQLGDVACHSLHQVPGVVSLDFKLALLLIIDL